MKRLTSFTIIELTVSLLISSIIISISYYTLFLAGRQFEKYRHRSSVINDFLLVEKALQIDFDFADEIRDSSAVTLVVNLNSRVQVRYDLAKDYIIRFSSGTIDSFKVSNPKLDLVYMNDNATVVKIARLQFSAEGEIFNMMFRKRYSAEQMMHQIRRKDE